MILKIFICLMAVVVSLVAASPACNNEYCHGKGVSTRFLPTASSDIYSLPTSFVTQTQDSHSFAHSSGSTISHNRKHFAIPRVQTLHLGPEHASTKARSLPVQTPGPTLKARSPVPPYQFSDPEGIVYRAPGMIKSTVTTSVAPSVQGAFKEIDHQPDLVRTSWLSFKGRTRLQPHGSADPAAPVYQAHEMKLPVTTSIAQDVSGVVHHHSTKTTTAPVVGHAMAIPDRVNTGTLTSTWNGAGLRPYGGGLIYIPDLPTPAIIARDISTQTPCQSESKIVQGANTFTSMWNGTGPRPYGGGLIHIPIQTSHSITETSLAKRHSHATQSTTCTTEVSNAPHSTKGSTMAYWNATMTSDSAPCSGCALQTGSATGHGSAGIYNTTSTVASTRTICVTACLP